MQDKENESKKSHGSPTFYKLLEEAAETHDKKSHDYASNENPYGNYHFAGQISALFAHSYKDAGFAGRLAEKMYRLSNLEGNQKIAQNESIEDTEKDLVTIMTLWMSDRRDRRKIADLEEVPFKPLEIDTTFGAMLDYIRTGAIKELQKVKEEKAK